VLLASLDLPIGEFDVIVPVPMTTMKRMRRGLNQATELAEPLAEHFELPIIHDALRKLRGRPQVGLGLKQRERNAARSFGIGREISRVHGKRVLLFDDVYTTGATVRTCSRLLLTACASVSVLTFARRSAEDLEHLLVDNTVRGKNA